MNDIDMLRADLAVVLGGRPEWHAKAACRGMGPDLFYPGRGEATEPAKRICASCEVKTECLADAFSHFDKNGIFGGRSERERRRMRRERRQALNRGEVLPDVSPIDTEPELVPRRPKPKPLPRFDGNTVVRPRRDKKKVTAEARPHRRRTTCFDGKQLTTGAA